MCSVDDRLYQWLKECCTATYARDTTLALTDFGSIFFDIQMNRFHYNLPLTVKKLKKKEEKANDFDRNRTFNKKQRDVKQERNEDMVKEWKVRQNEKWESVFRGKGNSGQKLSMGCYPCLKYHCKGVCYSDCANKASNMKLNHQDEETMKSFIKSLRGE